MKVLAIIDMQKDFIDGALGTKEAVSIVPKVAARLKKAREDGETVVFTRDTLHADYLSTQEGRKLPVPHCLSGSKGWELYGRVKDLSEGCLCFEKNTFGSDKLFDYLRLQLFDRIELVGLVSNICVLVNAALAGAASPDSVVSVDASCTASFDPSLHEKTLDVLSGIQVEITNR